MARHGRKPRPSSGIEKAADRQGWRATSVTHTTSHIHNALSRASPVLTHFSLTARSSLTHTHRFLGSRNSTGSSVLATQPQAFCLHARRDCCQCILCVPDDRDSDYVSSLSLSPISSSSRFSLTHTNRFLGFRNSTSTSVQNRPRPPSPPP